MNSETNKIMVSTKGYKPVPTLDLKLETKEVQGKAIYVPWLMVNPPYLLVSDRQGTRRVWIKNKKKIILYYLFRLTGRKWFYKKYVE